MSIRKVTDETKKIMDALTEINQKRCVEYMEVKDEIILVLEGIKIFRAKKLKYCIHAEMLPDIFTYSNWSNNIVVGTLHFNGQGDMCVNLDVKECDFGDLLSIIKDAVTDINLYAYKTTD